MEKEKKPRKPYVRTKPLLGTTELSPKELHDYRMREYTRGMTMKERVIAWYLSETPFTLTEHEDQMRRRWDRARELFLDGRGYNEIVQMLADEFGISTQLAKIDIRDMRNAFPKGDDITRDMHRERALGMVLKAWRIADEKNDTKQMNNCAKQYALITGLDKSEADKIDLDKIMKDRTYVEVLDPQVREMLMQLIGQHGGSIDTAKIFENMYTAKNAEEATYEDVPE